MKKKKRTQKEILKRFKEVDDLFSTQKQDLVHFMTFATAKPFLRPENVKEIEKDVPNKWKINTNPKKTILNYLSFAYDKAENQRGLSTARSMLHFKTWIWMDDPEFYEEIEHSIEHYTNYGNPVLDKIAKHYTYKPK